MPDSTCRPHSLGENCLMGARRTDEITWLKVETSDGVFLFGYSTQGLCAVSFPGRQAAKDAAHTATSAPAVIKRWHALATAALTRALAGTLPGDLPPLDLSSGTTFQQQVWRALLEIQPGNTSHYGRIAREIGRPAASRAVGAACGANPIPVFVPCHRVLAANDKLGGFSGGLDWKERLLRREGSFPSVSQSR